MTDPSRLRVSDADREQAAGDLRDHYAAGRISADELSDRLDAVYAAQTAAELDGLRVDLPDLRPVRRSDPRRALARRRLYQEAGGIVMADVAAVGVWVAVGAHGNFWPIWVILISALRLGRDGWRLFGPDGELVAGSGSGSGGVGSGSGSGSGSGTGEGGAGGGPDGRLLLRGELRAQRQARRAARRGR